MLSLEACGGVSRPRREAGLGTGTTPGAPDREGYLADMVPEDGLVV